MLYAGLDLSRRRLEVHVLDEGGGTVATLAVHPDADGLRSLAERFTASVTAAVESMNGARFVHDELGQHGWDVLIADAAKAKALAPLAAKTDKIDARVLAVLCWRDLVPAIWLPGPDTRAERERSRYRLYLVRHRTSIKNRVHATLITFGHTVPAADLFGARGRELLAALAIPEPWATTLERSLERLDALEAEIRGCEAELARLGADHPYVPLLRTVPGVGPILAYTIAAEIGDIGRFGSAKQLVGYTGLCPRVYQSGDVDRRGALSKTGPKYLRWALIEAAVHAAQHPRYRPKYERTKRRLGKLRGSQIARVELARELATAIWYMLTRQEPFRAVGPAPCLVA
jgi:transposase